ncbi:hypothetical protein BCR34DRAFT_22338 [Clohesyomyces aquaticus]|uniref:Uncharacterized protein n=1 Tax=Clohesyomyces aquaticus TaxID=1231657 RepID=A0A1Y2A530_9PLEO|nr:hypothetical protein BCR34DRAFT_22338 [Clohesyomyces aquaticus]
MKGQVRWRRKTCSGKLRVSAMEEEPEYGLTRHHSTERTELRLHIHTSLVTFSVTINLAASPSPQPRPKVGDRRRGATSPLLEGTVIDAPLRCRRHRGEGTGVVAGLISALVPSNARYRRPARSSRFHLRCVPGYGKPRIARASCSLVRRDSKRRPCVQLNLVHRGYFVM